MYAHTETILLTKVSVYVDLQMDSRHTVSKGTDKTYMKKHCHGGARQANNP